MTDTWTKEKRSEVMSMIRGRNNKSTELKLIQLLKQAQITGWRRNSRLPGKPDFVFPQGKVAIFVDGDFWHGNPKTLRLPKSNEAFWLEKISRNRKRDLLVTRQLKILGWSVLRIWETSLARFPGQTISRIRRVLPARLRRID